MAPSINGRTIMAPAAAATMALLLFTYTRSSIKEARRTGGQGGLKSRKTGEAEVKGKGEGEGREGK
ncbi:hypothetical protein K440DRAFT_617755 [Wilcoxina mikolae CBS 423.85]|nr:hypothetical protein K440DRAFT_617755 [Wilcoxina mikolae CBS 423.85]